VEQQYKGGDANARDGYFVRHQETCHFQAYEEAQALYVAKK
jgi:hypothetical protein